MWMRHKQTLCQKMPISGQTKQKLCLTYYNRNMSFLLLLASPCKFNESVVLPFFLLNLILLNFVPFICRAVAFGFLLLVIHNTSQRFCLQRKDQTHLHWGNTEFQSVFQCVFIVQLLLAVGNNSARGTFIKAIRIILLLPFLSFLLSLYSLEIIINHSTCLYTYTFTFFIGYIKPFSPMCMNP